jgi:hypothetical protein
MVNLIPEILVNFEGMITGTRIPVVIPSYGMAPFRILDLARISKNPGIELRRAA